MNFNSNRNTIKHFKGCLLCGAIGDVLGAPIEFMNLNEIRSFYGYEGLIDYSEAYGKTGAITDDTQMSLFTAEGLILFKLRQKYQKDNNVLLAVYHALLRWLYTQEKRFQNRSIQNYSTCATEHGVLTGYKELFSLRAPGNTCLSALRSSRMGTIEHPINNSKGCGGVMRVAPVGLAYQDAEKAFRVGCDCAAITHGHPSGYLSSGAMAAIISGIIYGESLMGAIDDAIKILKTKKDNNETLAAINNAIEQANKTQPSPEIIETLGAGWIAEEALAISLYCSLQAENNFVKGVLLAVNHSGDSDSTGSMTGNILGALNGLESIPENWLIDLELNKIIEEIATEIFYQFSEK